VLDVVENGAMGSSPPGRVRGPVPRHANLTAARRLARSLRTSDRLDEASDAVLTLAVGLAAKADDAIAGELPPYSLERVTNSYRHTLELLAELVGPTPGDPFLTFLSELSTPSRPEQHSPTGEAPTVW
jgi:hypothetical protein